MGKRLTEGEQNSLVDWARDFEGVKPQIVQQPVGKSLRENGAIELSNYWSLAALSRSQKRRPILANEALRLVFQVRTRLEKSLAASVKSSLLAGKIEPHHLFDGSFFGCSIKQGVSLRVPLTTCVPTADCRGGCYAHDGMDAGRNPVVKGVLNGLIAESYENGDGEIRQLIESKLSAHVIRAIAAARREAVAANFSRSPRIRFSHVGEVAAYADFANKLAEMVYLQSDGEVSCVIYTRHPNVKLLDPKYFVVNFTLDRGSMDRASWIPEWSRRTYSAWDGEISKDVDVNFIEHHRYSHIDAVGNGHVCPATRSEATEKTCDAVKCDLCFVRPMRA